MRLLSFVLGICVLLCLFGLPNVSSSTMCYLAKTCIHNGKEKCGVDGKGNFRRFFDSCDMLEYNCLKGTEYVRISPTKCVDLPHIEQPPLLRSTMPRPAANNTLK